MKKEKLLSIIFIILGLLMLIDAVLMFFNNEYQSAVKDIVFGIGFGCIGFVYLLSSKESD